MQGEITRLLQAHRDGDGGAFDQIVPLVYPELHKMASRQLRRHVRSSTLDTTALVHEAYLKIANAQSLKAESSTHLMAVLACAMRQIIISFARARNAAKRGGKDHPMTLEEDQIDVADHAHQLLEVDWALDRLRANSPRLAQIVECRFFGGLSDDETAAALGVSRRTVQREWNRARAWILEDLGNKRGAGVS